LKPYLKLPFVGVGAAWKTAGVEPGSTVAIFGLGSIGLAVWISLTWLIISLTLWLFNLSIKIVHEVLA
jgi:hypothetical protein